MLHMNSKPHTSIFYDYDHTTVQLCIYFYVSFTKTHVELIYVEGLKLVLHCFVVIVFFTIMIQLCTGQW